MLLRILIGLVAARDGDVDDPPARVPIGEAAATEDERSAPSGLPPEEAQRGSTVDEDPESQETG